LHTSKPPKIHRDIKPANILINTRGECKIADFGIYREMDATGSANAHTFIGSLSFMSPERIRGDEYGCPADVWSIGLTLMTVALGRCPVTDNGRGYWALLHELTDKPPPTLPDDMPFTPLIRDFLSKLLTAEPKERWSAKKLLTHPFMSEHGYFETSDFYIPSSIPHTNTSSGNSAYMDHDGNYNISDLQWSELNQVIDKLAKRTTDILSSNLYNYSNPEPLPKISDEKLIRFSEQIDMPKALVKEAFEKKFNGNDLPKLLV
jgi:serine/threonine protein kinase